MYYGITHELELGRSGGLKRDGVRSLLRRPMVQAALLLAAGMQVVAAKQAASSHGDVALRLSPVVVTRAADEVSLEKMAADYKAEGYDLSLSLAETIQEAASDNGIDPKIAFGLVRAESSFRNAATSTVGAVGLTQLMPSTARWLEPGVTRSDLRDPETNLRIGFRYLRQLIDKYEGDVDLALVAYNRGPGTVDNALKRGRNPDNGYAAFVRGEKNHGHKLFTK